MNIRQRAITRKQYESYLNKLGASLDEEEFIIGGRMRANKSKYGYYMRLHDPIGFEVGFNEWCKEQWATKEYFTNVLPGVNYFIKTVQYNNLWEKQKKYVILKTLKEY